jgi:DNA replication protein DnaC
MAKRLDDALSGTPLPSRDASDRQPQPPAASDVHEQPPTGTPYRMCPICGGAGFLRAEVQYGDPFFGRLVDCECRQQQSRERDFANLQRFSNLEPFKNKTFENFDTRVQGVSEAFTAARSFAKEPKGWLILVGGFGSGKTHLAAAIANLAVSQHFPVLFSVVPDLLDHLRSTFGPNSDIQYDALFEKVRTTALLVLDDLGTENATPWAEEKLFQIINYRYNYALPTVITTNRDLNIIDGRIRSRMLDKAFIQVFEIKAVDYRLREKGARRPIRSRRV